MKINFISICTYFCGVFPIYCSLSNYYGTQWVWEPFCAWILFRYNGYALEACLIHKEGVLTMWLWESSYDDCQSPIFFITNVISVTSIHPMHTFLVSTLCRLLLGMKAFYEQLLWFWLISFTWYIFVIFVMKFQKPFSSIGIISLWYLLPISKHLHYLLFP